MIPKDSNLTIFVHRASEHLTDHEPHGDGLICFSILNGLAERGHRIFAFTDKAAIKSQSDNLKVFTATYSVPANSLIPWELAVKANVIFDKLKKQHAFDLVWRMHPYSTGCPIPPKTGDLPLVVGPLFYGWPKSNSPSKAGAPRFGISLNSVVLPLANRGWNRTLSRASQIFCATENQTSGIHRLYPKANVSTLPVIVDPPKELVLGQRKNLSYPVRLIFIANLVDNKNPKIFCETIFALNKSGIATAGTVIGDGHLRAQLEAYCRETGIRDKIEFMGKVPNSDVLDHVAKSDMLVSCSFGEPYGRGIVEAMAVGTPCICHKSGGPADFIKDNLNGLLVNEISAEAFCEAVKFVASDPLTWQRLSKGALLSASPWTSERVIDQLESQLCHLAMSHRERVKHY